MNPPAKTPAPRWLRVALSRIDRDWCCRPSAKGVRWWRRHSAWVCLVDSVLGCHLRATCRAHDHQITGGVGVTVPDQVICAHCCRPMEGFAALNNDWLCHPDEGMDCYRLVTVYHHRMPCLDCTTLSDMQNWAKQQAIDAARGRPSGCGGAAPPDSTEPHS